MAAPETRYARNSGGDSIAYQVLGNGPLDLVWVPGFVSHVELAWAEPTVARFFERLASFSRLVLFDKRGTGLSDPVPGPLPLEQRMEDVRAVMEAAGVERAALVGLSEGAAMSVLLAATYPEQVSALVLCGTILGGPAENHPAGARWNDVVRQVEEAAEHWGDGSTLRLLGPDLEATERQLGTLERLCASPRMAASLLKMWTQIDIRDLLPSVKVPTLVVHRRDELFPVEAAREVASRIADARLAELPGRDHVPWSADADAYLDEIEEFLTGIRAGARVRDVLATVLFTDVVDSTQRAAQMGDAAWSDLLARHDELVRRQLRLFGGREVKHTGDGFLATFDGPARAIRCSRTIVRAAFDELELDLRAGVHTGECEVAGDDLRGMAVHIGSRVAAAAGAREVLVSGTVKELVVGSGLTFDDRGLHALKGVPGEWRLYAASDPESASAPAPVEPPATNLGDRAGAMLARRSPRVAQLLLKSEQRAARAVRSARARTR